MLGAAVAVAIPSMTRAATALFTFESFRDGALEGEEAVTPLDSYFVRLPGER
jgi:hypothetical protein